MFDGTDLSLAYGASSYEPVQQATPVSMSAPMPPKEVAPKVTASHATAPEVAYAPPPAMYAQQSPTVLAPPTESFWERLASKKWDVVKMVVLALVVLLGITMDRLATHYMTAYISKSFLTEMQEFIVRLGYPIAIIVVLWVIKAL